MPAPEWLPRKGANGQSGEGGAAFPGGTEGGESDAGWGVCDFMEQAALAVAFEGSQDPLWGSGKERSQRSQAREGVRRGWAVRECRRSVHEGT